MRTKRFLATPIGRTSKRFNVLRASTGARVYTLEALIHSMAVRAYCCIAHCLITTPGDGLLKVDGLTTATK